MRWLESERSSPEGPNYSSIQAINLGTGNIDHMVVCNVLYIAGLCEGVILEKGSKEME